MNAISPRYAAMRLRRSLARRGALGTVRLAVWHAVAPARAAMLAVRERRFDAHYGVDTRGSVRVRDGSIHRDSFKYTGASPVVFRALLANLPADPSSLTFVDVGCGKGRTFVLAAEAGFARLVGVELSPELAAAARRNLDARGIRGEIVEGDAAQFAFPDDPLFVFLFNPFGETTLCAVLEELRRSHRGKPRPIFLGYQNPIHGDRVVAAGFLPVADGRDWALFAAA
jgi:SAM-dependent methyltransferase